MINVNNLSDQELLQLANTVTSWMQLLKETSWKDGIRKARISGALEGILITFGQLEYGKDMEFIDIIIEGYEFPWFTKKPIIKKETYPEHIYRKSAEFTKIIMELHGNLVNKE